MPKCDFNKTAKTFIEITLRHGYSRVNLLYIFRTPFPKKSSGGLLLLIRNSNVNSQKQLNLTVRQLYPLAVQISVDIQYEVHFI